MSKEWTIENAAASRGPALHPLAGANLRALIQHISGNEDFDSRSRLQRVVAWASVVARFPFYHFESAYWKKAIEDEPFEKPPIFLLGHWRSGTTHLHNLLSHDSQFGYLNFAETALPWNMLGKKAKIARSVMRMAIPKTRGMDNVRISVDEPQEEEMALGNMNPIGFYNVYYYPQTMEEHARRALFFDGVSDAERDLFERTYQHFIKKLNYAKQGRQLLLKNPPSTTRIPMLRRLFPNAKFIHIVRNPYAVYRSTMGMFPRLFNAFAWQKFDDVDLKKFTRQTYRDVMETYLRDRELIPKENLVETSFEAITADPLSEIAKIYDQFGIPEKENGLAEIGNYVESLKGYERNAHEIAAEDAERIREEWKFSFEAWGYSTEIPKGIETV